MNTEITKENLDRLYAEVFSAEKFLSVDPCGIVYELRQHTDIQLDIELGALFVAMITWGNRKAIRTAARHMLKDEMLWHPADFIVTGRYKNSYSTAKNKCVYRTLNSDNFKLVCQNIHNALLGYFRERGEMPKSLEQVLLFCSAAKIEKESGNVSVPYIYNMCNPSVEDAISVITQWLAPAKLGTAGKSACKRICMYLRWMIRQESPDLGLWKEYSQRELYAVMDVHVCQLTAPILKTRQANWRACCELTGIFRQWDAEDPLRYDVALMTLADEL